MLTWAITCVKLDLVFIVALIVGGGGGGFVYVPLLSVLSSYAIILIGKRELDALL